MLTRDDEIGHDYGPAMVIELLSEYVIFDKKVLNVLEINALQI